jgi:hypothetical protein
MGRWPRLLGTISIVIVCVGVFAPPSATAQAPACARPVPFPDEVQIVDPGSTVSPSLAAFAGVWEGEWDTRFGGLSARLAVQEITPTSARVTYSFGGETGMQPAARELRYQVQGDRVLTSGGLSWTLSADGQSIVGSLRQGDSLNRAVMTRCAMRETWAQASRVLVRDDFANATGGWPRESSDSAGPR